MWNIMRAQNYQIKRDNLVIIGFLVCLVLPVIGIYLADIGADNMDGSLFTVAMFGIFPFTFLALSLILVTRICAWDMNDKTINYELLAGHSRIEVYFGRVLSALAWMFAGCILVSLIPILVFTAFKGWGHSLDMGEAVIRYAVMLLVLFRWACELMLLTFLLRNSHAALVLGFVIFDFGTIFSVIMESMEMKIDWQLASANLMNLSDVSNYRNIMIGDMQVTVYEAALGTSALMHSVAASIVVGIVCVAIGYAAFRRRDMA